MADVLQQELGVETKLVQGHGGIFEVAVEGRVVAKKSPSGFPTEQDCVEAVRSATAG